MTSSSEKFFFCMFKIKFPTKHIFRIFPILRINGMAPFCNLFMERPSYYCYQWWWSVLSCDYRLICLLVRRASSPRLVLAVVRPWMPHSQHLAQWRLRRCHLSLVSSSMGQHRPLAPVLLTHHRTCQCRPCLHAFSSATYRTFCPDWNVCLVQCSVRLRSQ